MNEIDRLVRENETLRRQLTSFEADARRVHHAQQALRASEALNRGIVESIPMSLFVKDRSSIYLVANERYAASLGCGPAQVVGKDDFAFFPVELANQYRADDKAVMESGKVKNLIVPYVAQGKESWVHAVKAPLRSETGEVIAVLGLLEDVTERRRVEHALEASETRYRRLFEAARDGILILNATTGKIVDVNPFLIELTGYSREEFLDRHLWEIGAFKDIAASKESFADLQTVGYVCYDDLPLKSSDGRKIDVEFVSNLYSVDGQKVIQCNIRDIRARKLGDAARALLTVAIEQASEIVVITDSKGSIWYVNPAFEVATGYTRAEVAGANPRLLKSGVQDDAFYADLWKTISAGETWHGRLVNKRKDGTLYTEDSTILPVRDQAGVITNYVAMKRDITPDLALESQFLQAQRMEGIGRLAGGVAHDFNNLLSVILSYTSVALDSLTEGDPLREDLLEVMAAGERAATLTRQLLAFSRKQVLKPQPLDLNDVSAGLEKMLRRILGEDIEFVQKLAPDLGLVLADPGRVEQVLMNLVVNARDAMPKGGKLTIETANIDLDEEYVAQHVGVKPGPHVMLAVTDSGSGMDEATRRRIFEPFFTTKALGKGTGLGLSTAYGIVKQSGGNIWVYSEPGHGTTFKIYLPRELSATLPSTEPLPPPTHALGTETILVVEDEPALRKVAKRTLEAASYTVLTATDAADAFAVSVRHEGEIRLLLTDVVMPGMSGSALAEGLLKTRPAMRVLYMSGYTDDAVVQHGVLDEGALFLEKPFTSANLVRKVREVLDAAPVARSG